MCVFFLRNRNSTGDVVSIMSDAFTSYGFSLVLNLLGNKIVASTQHASNIYLYFKKK